MPPIDAFQHTAELRGGDGDRTIRRRWPNEPSALQSLGIERHAETVMPQDLQQIARPHVIPHTDRNLLLSRIPGTLSMVSESGSTHGMVGAAAKFCT
jgi:hypothetical protein